MLEPIRKIFIYPGQYTVYAEPMEISTILGSCVAVALYDPFYKIGGLNHYLLPEVISGEMPSGRYGDYAIQGLIQLMERTGAKKGHLQSKIFGGANVLTSVAIGAEVGIQNIKIAHAILDTLGIPIVYENVGGNRGRKIVLNTSTFEVFHEFMSS